MDLIFEILLTLLTVVLVTFGVGSGDDDDDDYDDDDDDSECAQQDLCDSMIQTGFLYDFDECITWFDVEGQGDCEDFNAFNDCACDCLGKGPAYFETCLGQCLNGNFFIN